MVGSLHDLVPVMDVDIVTYSWIYLFPTSIFGIRALAHEIADREGIDISDSL